MSFNTSEIATAVAKRVAELTDRSSPDDWPEAMLVTAEELIFIVEDELHEAFLAAISQSPIEEATSVADTVPAASEQGKSPDGDRALVNQAPDGSSPFGLPSLSQAEQDQSAWLIEMDDTGRPTYWCRLDDEDGICGWSNDHDKAVRFCRRQDAAAIIDDMGWTEPKPVEHGWTAPRKLLRTRNPEECGDGVAPKGALQPGSGGDALDRGLPRQLSIHLCAQDGLFHAFSDDVPEFYVAGRDSHAVLDDASIVLATILRKNYGASIEEFCERNSALKAANTQSPDEEPALAAAEELTVGDLRRARAALNTPENADSASVTAEEASEATSVGQNPSGRL